MPAAPPKTKERLSFSHRVKPLFIMTAVRATVMITESAAKSQVALESMEKAMPVFRTWESPMTPGMSSASP